MQKEGLCNRMSYKNMYDLTQHIGLVRTYETLYILFCIYKSSEIFVSLVVSWRKTSWTSSPYKTKPKKVENKIK